MACLFRLGPVPQAKARAPSRFLNSKFKVQSSKFKVRRWTLDVGRWTFEVRLLRPLAALRFLNSKLKVRRSTFALAFALGALRAAR